MKCDRLLTFAMEVGPQLSEWGQTKIAVLLLAAGC